MDIEFNKVLPVVLATFPVLVKTVWVDALTTDAADPNAFPCSPWLIAVLLTYDPPPAALVLCWPVRSFHQDSTVWPAAAGRYERVDKAGSFLGNHQ